MITDLLYERASASPHAPFLRFGADTLSFGDVAALVSALAHRLATRGVKPGDRVALICGNRPGFLVTWFALSELGAICVPLNTALVADGLRYTLTQSQASALVIEPGLLAEKEGHLGDLLGKLEVILIDDSVERLPESAAPRCRAADIKPGDPNSILFTSGTTGLPKGAIISNRCYLSAGEDMAASLEITADDRILLFLPLFHANPQMYGVMSVLQAGASIVLLPRFSASDFFDEAKRHGATGFTFVGTVLSILEKRHPGRRRDHKLKWAVGGGAPEAIWSAVETRFGVDVRELYGMTETGGWVSMNRPGHVRRGSVGAPRKGVDLAIVDAEARRLPTGERGEIIARTDRPNLFFDGYWRNETATAETLRDGWLHTGDLGWLDADGYLHFEGRVKELIRRGGEMISPVEIELQLLKHDQVRDCGVFAVPDEILGEEIKVAVVAGEAPGAQELKSFLAARLPQHMIPRYVVFVDEISKTETAKIKRHELHKLVGPQLDLKAV